MKLVDFRTFDSLDALRKAMGAELIEFSHILSFEGLRPESLELLETKGIEVNFNEITIQKDQTLSYKGRRIILYIRDWTIYQEQQKESEPKFHIANCKTYQDMCKKGRKQRYVVSSRDDGLFYYNRIHNNKIIEKDLFKKLEICSNCLSKIAWMDYHHNLMDNEKLEIKERFTLEKFFKCYPKDLLNRSNHLYDTLAPENQYPEDWSSIARTTKESKDFTCENCKINLRSASQYLDVHHMDGLKSNNKRENLKVLCVKCHADLHPHMRKQRRLENFLQHYSKI